MAVVLFGAIGLALYLRPSARLPKPTGQFAIGYKTIDREKSMQLHIWYPAQAVLDDQPRFVFSQQYATAVTDAMKSLKAPGFLYSHFRHAKRNSVDDGPIAVGKFPLVVFNHGGALWPMQSTALMEELASHGYIVCALAHPGESLAIAWANGDRTLIDADKVMAQTAATSAIEDHANFLVSQDEAVRRKLFFRLHNYYKNTLTDATHRWADQSIETVDWLLAGRVVQIAEITDSIDQQFVIYGGMSLGGSTAHECCYRDTRAVAGFNLDGMNFSFDRADTEVPTAFLQLYGDWELTRQSASDKATIPVGNSKSKPRLFYNDYFYERSGTRGSRDDVIRVEVKGAGHMSFTDQALAARGPMKKLLGTGRVDGVVATRAINVVVRTFLDGVRKGDFGCVDKLTASHPLLARLPLVATD